MFYSANLVNTKREKSANSKVSLDGKNFYTLTASNKFYQGGKNNDNVNTEAILRVSSVNKNIINVEATADLKKGKSLIVNGKFEAYRLLTRPVELLCEL